jgi:protein-S-isoprenylcysteine O-methyltransferase Ste14
MDILKFEVSVLVVVVGWFSLGLVFVFSRQGSRKRNIQRAPSSLLGLGLQGLGLAIVFACRRKSLEQDFSTTSGLEWGLLLFGIFLLLASVVLMNRAFRALGEQWSLTARILEDHNLITAGPYGLVRHPIYTALLGMLVGSGVLVTDWKWGVAGLMIYWVGTVIRIQHEEKLLRETFGQAYLNYSSQVPALLPWKISCWRRVLPLA